MTKEEVLQVITDNITDNNSGAITAAVMRDTLNTMVEYTPEGSSAIPVFEGILEDSITITDTTVLDDTGGVVIYSSYHKKFVLSLDRAYYSSWGNVVAYMDNTTGLPITNRLFEYNKQQYVFNGTDLVPLSIGIGYTYIGTATPSTTPMEITAEDKVFYIAVEEGDYTGFGQNDIKELTIFKSGEGRWIKEELGISFIVNTKDIADNTITLQKTNFGKLGKNLFNKDTVTVGILSQGSILTTYKTWRVSDKIYVKPNTNYIFSANRNYNIRYALYANDDTVISYNDQHWSTNPILTSAETSYMRISVNADVIEINQVQVEEGTVATEYEEWSYTIDESVLPKTKIENIFEGVEISLPDKIYAVVGDTLQLFYNGMVKAVNPFIFNILTNCSKGAMYPRYWQYTPTNEDVGSTTFTLKVLDSNRNIICEKSTILQTVTEPISPSSDIHIACFGDSLTAGGIWCHECDRRLTGAGGTPVGKGLSNITFVGAKEKDGTHYYGGSGWSWRHYTTNTVLAFRFVLSGFPQLGMDAIYSNNGHEYKIIEIIDDTILCSAVSDGTPTTPDNWEHYQPQASGTLTKVSGTGDDSLAFTSYVVDSANPLWDYDNNKMSFIPYANDYCNGQIDVVYVFLTWNSPMTNWKSDFSDMLTQATIFADTLHSEFPNAKLKLMAVQFPSIKRGMPDYGASGYGHSDVYGMMVSVFNMNKAYQDWCNQDGYSSWCEFVNVASQFDSDYCMNIIEKNVNTRSSLKEYVVHNGVHPKTEGYYQIADVVYRNIVANFCQ